MVGRPSRPTSPTARRYQLASRLKQLRVDAGRTPDDVARELICSPAKVTRIENGQRIATPLDLKVLAQFYGLSDADRDELMRLATDARKRGWWQDYRSLNEQTQTYLGLEAAATRLDSMSAILLPGLLQTPAYTRSVIPRLRTPETWAPDVVEQVVETRLRRQRRVTDGTLHLRAVIDEAALSRRIGLPPLRIEQVAHLIEMAACPNVELQVVTLDVGAHPGLDGSFYCLSFPDGEPGDLVLIEHLASNHMLREEDRAEVVDQFRAVHEYIRTKVALSVIDTKTWLHQFLQQLEGGSPTATI